MVAFFSLRLNITMLALTLVIFCIAYIKPMDVAAVGRCTCSTAVQPGEGGVASCFVRVIY